MRKVKHRESEEKTYRFANHGEIKLCSLTHEYILSHTE